MFGLPFTIEYNANGGAGTMSPQSKFYGVENYEPQGNVSACTFTKDRYAFNGWNTRADGSGISIQGGAEAVSVYQVTGAEAGGTITLYAQWRYVGFDVTVTKSPGSPNIGTLTLIRTNEPNDPVAVEQNGTLHYSGVPDNSTYRVICTLSDSSPDKLYDATGIANLANNQFSPAEGDSLAFSFVFTAKPIFAFSVSSEHGTVEVSPPEDATGGKYLGGRAITLTITPDAGYRATQVVFKNTQTNALEPPIPVDGDTVVLGGISYNTQAIVDYVLIDYSLSASIDAPSTVAVTAVSVTKDYETAETAHYGDTVVFTATVANGYSFAGWYDAETDVLVSDSASYETTVHGDISLVATAKVAVSLGISYDESEGEQNCSLTVEGEAYTPGTSFYVMLGDSFEYVLSLGERVANAPWALDCWKSGDTILTYGVSAKVKPTSALSMIAYMTDEVLRELQIYVVNAGDFSAAVVDADALTGAVTCYGEATTATVNHGGAGAADPFRFAFAQTQIVHFTASASLTFAGESEAKAFYCFSTEGPDAERDTVMPPNERVLSYEASEALLLNTESRTIYAYYGTPTIVTTSIAYSTFSDSTMGAIAIVATDPTDNVENPIAADGMSAQVTQGKTLTIRAVAFNGFSFAGWHLSVAAIGGAEWSDAEKTIKATTQRTIYAKFVQDPHSVCEWEGTRTPKAMTWRSKTYEASKPFNPSACRVDALGYVGDRRGTLLEFAVDMFSAPNAAATATTRLTNIANQNARRLPVMRPERYMQVEVKANAEVDALLVGTSMGGLAQ